MLTLLTGGISRLFYLLSFVPVERDTTALSPPPPMTTSTLERSVWGASTDELKDRFRSYLKELASTDDGYRRELIDALEWCFDRWNYWREKFYPETPSPLKFPFLKSAKGGSEFGHYATVGDSGEPSVIHIKRAYLMGERDITLVSNGDQKLVLKKDHPDRLNVVDLTILHELVHQYLREGADEKTRLKYETSEMGSNHYKGHGKLFRDECNRINQILHKERGMEFVPVRHSKRSHETAACRQRPSCAQFTKSDLFFAWDPDPKAGLSREQELENEARLIKALQYFGADQKGEGGAIEMVTEETVEDTDFPAPYDSSCADVCINELTEWDQAKGVDLVRDFHLTALKNMQETGVLDQLLVEIGFSAAPSNISPASGENQPVVNVPAHGDTTEFKVGDYVHHSTYGSCEVMKIFGSTDNGGQTVAIDSRQGPKIVASADVRACKVTTTINDYGVTITSIDPVDVPVEGDSQPQWQKTIAALHAEGVVLGEAVAQVINSDCDGQKPDRKSKFNVHIAEVFGVSREAVRLWVKKTVEANEALVGAA